MKRFDRHVGALQAALEQTPEVLYALRIDLPANVLFNVVYRVVDLLARRQIVIGRSGIGVHG